MIEPAVTWPRSAPQQVGDRLQDGGLAGAVGAEQRHDLAAADRQADPAQGDDALVVGGLDVTRDEQGLAIWPMARFPSVR